MKSDYTHVTILVDESGSMSGLKSETLTNLENFLREQKAVQGKMTLSLWFFNTDYRRIFHGDIQGIRLEPEQYNPNGYTALYDATARAIDDTGKFLADTPEHERPSKVIFVTITDGFENSSREFSAESVRSRVKHQTEKYGWQFVFLGADIDSYAVGGAMGYGAGSTSNYSKWDSGTAYSILSSNLVRCRVGASDNVDFSAADKAVLEAVDSDGSKV